MTLREIIFGRPLRSDEAKRERIGVLAAMAFLGLDALASAAYGPEAALTVFVLAGHSGLQHVLPISACVVVLLLLVQFSYRQTVRAYPGGGGSYTVCKENLGRMASLFAVSSLAVDYILNVAVAISAGVGALVSAIPALLPHTLQLTLGTLLLLMLMNLRGIRTTGFLFAIPTCVFIGSLGGVLVVGVTRAALAGGHPTPVVAPKVSHLVESTAGLWLVARAFASGCTALTGIEAVSNAVPLFWDPAVRRAQRTLTSLMTILSLMLLGIAVLCRAYRVEATRPGESGYESVLSQIIGAVAGRGVFYDTCIASIIAMLCLSANTSFAGFPRLCRLLALDDFLPEGFARLGRRLVYTRGIVLLTVLAGALLIVFGGITDRLIPLFAVGAFAAFTASQFGMVAHWRRSGRPHARQFQVINGLGGVATLITLLIIVASKLSEGAWISIVAMCLLMAILLGYHGYVRQVDVEVRATQFAEIQKMSPPIVIVPVKRWDQVARQGLAMALSISSEVYVVQVHAVGRTDDVSSRWEDEVAGPLRSRGLPAPVFVPLRSSYREFIDPLLGFVRRVAAEHPDRNVAVLIPELVEGRRLRDLFRSRTATLLKTMLLLHGGPRITVMGTRWYAHR